MAGWILESRNPEVLLRLPPGAVKTIGRTSRADFILDAALVSRLHCRVTASAESLTVEDLDSTNGIQVNGKRANRATLKAGDILSIGRVDLEVKSA
jgi:pSer/pThr/pTyr-binding forkhead associated (FHA) protein